MTEKKQILERLGCFVDGISHMLFSGIPDLTQKEFLHFRIEF